MQVEPKERGPTEEADAGRQTVRRRVIDGLAAAIADGGYVATTIADIARHARVSKRTFYEHFADKEECFLAGYAAVADETLALITEAASQERDWLTRVHRATRAYLEALEAFPALARTYLVEIYAAGPRALELRREMHGRFAEHLRAMTDAARAEQPSLRPLTPEMATAIVGALNELVLVALERGRGRGQVLALADTASDLLVSVMSPRPVQLARVARRARARPRRA